MWDFVTADQVKARAGVSAVLKKDGLTESKFIMACPANFLLADVELRGSQGIGGSAAMRILHLEDQEIEMDVGRE